LKEGIQQGAKILLGKENLDDEKLSSTCYFNPVIAEVKPDNKLFHEETFGPIFAVTSFKTDEELIRLANDSEYGLSAAIMSKNTERAQSIGKNLDVGAVYVNTPVSSDSRFPSGGVKNSGYGRECGILGAREFTNAKTVWIK